MAGRVVDAKGKPIPGLRVSVYFENREVWEAFKALKNTDALVTDGNGEFRIDSLFPEQRFLLQFAQGNKRYGPTYQKAPKHTVAKHCDTVKLGNLSLEPAMEGEEK